MNKNILLDKQPFPWYPKHTIKRLFNRNIFWEVFTMKKTYKIEVDCANCANKMELAAAKTAGVRSASVNFMMQKMIVEFEEGAVPQDVMVQVRKACKQLASDCEVFL